MDNLISWMLLTETGSTTARTVMVLMGLAIWVNLMLLATYVNSPAVPLRVAALIVLGACAGAGAVHAGLWGQLIHGAVYTSAASGIVLLLLICVVGTPKRLSEHFWLPIDRKGWWAANVVKPVAQVKNRVSNWGELQLSRGSKRGDEDS